MRIVLFWFVMCLVRLWRIVVFLGDVLRIVLVGVLCNGLGMIVLGMGLLVIGRNSVFCVVIRCLCYWFCLISWWIGSVLKNLLVMMISG